MGTSLRLSRTARVALLVAAVYGAGLLVAGFVVPVYGSESVSVSGTVGPAVTTTSAETVTRHAESATLVAVNGAWAAVVLAAPLVATLLVAVGLRLRDRRGAMPAAWILTGLLGVLNMLAMLTVGVFLLPVTACLLVACAASLPAVSLPQAPSTP